MLVARGLDDTWPRLSEFRRWIPVDGGCLSKASALKAGLVWERQR